MTNQDTKGDFSKKIEKELKKNEIKNESVTVKKDIKTKSYRQMRSRKKKNERAKKNGENEVDTKREGRWRNIEETKKKRR